VKELATVAATFVPTVLDAAPGAMLVVDDCGSIVAANRQVTALLGYERAELPGLAVDALIPGWSRHRHAGLGQRHAATDRRRRLGSDRELFALRKDGSEVPVEVNLSPITEGPGALVAAALRDVTDRRRARLAPQAARESAERANLAKSRFLATASHDLRQPLQTLSLLNGSLRRMVTEPDLIGVLGQQDQAIQAMTRLLNALLDISKLESGAIRPEITDFTVQALFEELRTEFAALAANKGLRLEVEPCAAAIRSDPTLIGQVLRNLVSNAIKYTREGFVRLRCAQEQAFVRLEVLDTGIGIPRNRLPCICDEFYQVDVPSNTARDGYGLGLSIVQRIARLLDLRLDVESEVGRGSTFALSVPASNVVAAQVTGGPTRAAATSGSVASSPHVLLVEDDEPVRSATRLLLQVAGYRVSVAGSVAEALTRVREQPDVDLLVSDYHLGGAETGTQAIAAVREVVGARLRAVLVTGDTSSAVRERAFDFGTRIASKPINADEFLALLEDLR
jgi:two-component system, sensor histidine kinase